MKNKVLKLFRITQDETDGYDTYDSAIVAAPDEATARRMCPGTGKVLTPAKFADYRSSRSWATSVTRVTAVCIGEASEGVGQGVLCASYNAG